MAIERPAHLGPMASDGYAPIDEALKSKLLSVGVPTLSAVMFKKGLTTRFFRELGPLNPNASKFCGAAYTVRAIPVREDLRTAIAAFEIPSRNRRAFDAAPPGSVIVCSTGDKPHLGLMGDIMTTSMMTRGVAGVVLDAGVADSHFISSMPFPVLATGSAPVSSFAEIMIVDHDTPIGVRGVAVFPGDVIVGDQNGAVCIPRHIAEAVADGAIETEALEEFILERIRAGAPIDGTYPADAATMDEYSKWREAKAGNAA
jgi:regulator of RNase E activity RraA